MVCRSFIEGLVLSIHTLREQFITLVYLSPMVAHCIATDACLAAWMNSFQA